MSVTSAIKRTVSISLFNRGQAGKVFDEVKRTGPKVVIKNNEPECVIMSPNDYVDMIDELEDLRLLAIAYERLENYDPSKTITQEELMAEFGWSQKDLDDMDDVEIEGPEDYAGR